MVENNDVYGISVVLHSTVCKPMSLLRNRQSSQCRNNVVPKSKITISAQIHLNVW